jgi:hypothetical protein
VEEHCPETTKYSSLDPLTDNETMRRTCHTSSSDEIKSTSTIDGALAAFSGLDSRISKTQIPSVEK